MKPGFVDLQVNGFLGVDFSSPALTAGEIAKVSAALRSRGTAAYCPTIVTAPESVYERNLPLLADAVEANRSGILGIHVEGPFISPISKGAHSQDLIRPLSTESFDRWQGLARGNIRLMTIAPELPGAEQFIIHLRRAGVAVSLGHHFAEEETIQRAVAAGATASTHLGNGIPLQLRRHPNPIWSQLANDDIYAMCICDGHHVPPEFIKIVLRIKTASKFIVVSDAAPIAGLPPGRYSYFGTDVVLEESGRIVLASDQGLAGASCSLLECMNFLAGLDLLEEADLWRVGFENPLKLIGKQGHSFSDDGPSVVFQNDRFVLTADCAAVH